MREARRRPLAPFFSCPAPVRSSVRFTSFHRPDATRRRAPTQCRPPTHSAPPQFARTLRDVARVTRCSCRRCPALRTPQVHEPHTSHMQQPAHDTPPAHERTNYTPLSTHTTRGNETQTFGTIVNHVVDLRARTHMCLSTVCAQLSKCCTCVRT